MLCLKLLMKITRMAKRLKNPVKIKIQTENTKKKNIDVVRIGLKGGDAAEVTTVVV